MAFENHKAIVKKLNCSLTFPKLKIKIEELTLE
jgi:hypothetical protein